MTGITITGIAAGLHPLAWLYVLLAVEIVIWFRCYAIRFFKGRPEGRPGIWTLEMERERQANIDKRWAEKMAPRTIKPPAKNPDAKPESN